MRRISMYLLVAVAVTLSFHAATATVPTKINVQGRLTDLSGVPLPAGSKTLSFSIWDAEAGGAKLWPDASTEDQVVTTGSDGLWTTFVGALQPLTPDVFADSTTWLEITVNDGVNPLVTLPRVRLVPGPYAFRVETVDGATGGHISGKLNIGGNNTNPAPSAFVVGDFNDATGQGSVVIGGSGNQATFSPSTAIGGSGNTASGSHSFVTGESNTASGDWSSVTGGNSNLASGSNASVVGGSTNAATASQSFVGGGGGNWAGAGSAVAVGGDQNQASAQDAAVVGGFFNRADGVAAFVGSGGYNKAYGDYAVVAGGGGSTDADSNAALSDHATVGGGQSNTARGRWSTIAGGHLNEADSGGTVGGGAYNVVSDAYSVVAGGGGYNTLLGNQVTGRYSGILGGRGNKVSGFYSVIGGGSYNLASGSGAAIGGGDNNEARNSGSFIGGGGHNVARGYYASVVGGGGNSSDSNAANGSYSAVGGGRQNIATAQYGTIGGGYHNEASGSYTTIPGGYWNTATGFASFVAGGRLNQAQGNYAFAGGYFAYANHPGCFVWADTTTPSFASTKPNQFLIKAGNGVGIGTNNPEGPLHIMEGSAGSVTANDKAPLIVERDGESWIHILSPAANQRGILFGSPSNSLMGSIRFNPPGAPRGFHFRCGYNDIRLVLDSLGNLSADGCVSGSNIACVSDRRLKKNIRPLGGSLEEIDRLRGVRYEWRRDEFPDRSLPEGEQIGLLAQEVREVVPEAVIEQSDGYLAVDYTRLVPLLIEAVKAQQQRIDDLEETVASMRP